MLLIRTLDQMNLTCPETFAVVALHRSVLFGQGFSKSREPDLPWAIVVSAPEALTESRI